MATSLAPVVLTRGVWVDLYAATGIVAGTQIVVQNTGNYEAELTEAAAMPTGTYGFNNIPPDTFLTNAAANVGAWAYSHRGTRLQVEEA